MKSFQKFIFIITLCSYIFTVWLLVNSYYNSNNISVIKKYFEIYNIKEQIFTFKIDSPADYRMMIRFYFPKKSNPKNIPDYFDSFVNDTTLNFYWKVVDMNQNVIKQDSTQSFFNRKWKLLNSRELGSVTFPNEEYYLLYIKVNKLVPKLFQSMAEIRIKAIDYKFINYFHSNIWAFIINFILSFISFWIFIYIRKKQVN